MDQAIVPGIGDGGDALGETLHFLRMSGVFYSSTELTAPWGLALPAMPRVLLFHVITEGQCWLVIDGTQRHLQRGDFVLVPHGAGHALVAEPDAPTTPLFDLPRELISTHYEILRHGGGGEATRMICGAVRFDHPAAQHLVALLPKTILVRDWEPAQQAWVNATLQLMASEVTAPQPGGETVVTRLADILVIQAIRHWIACDPAARTGWLGALQDKQIGRAILLIHREPGQSWTVDSLAHAVAMSRSAFAARFRELVGESPMQYTTRWRMHQALEQLHEGNPPLGELAQRLGYQSEAAFSRAFKRFVGVSPGAARRQVA